MEIVRIPLAKLETNIGQIADLPMNPRQWTQDEIDKLAKSLTETPELFEARPLLVVPHEGKYVVLGGNLRLEACKKNKDADAPAIVFPEDMPVEKMREIVVKDNGSFGAWDWDALANEWDDLPLGDWGVPSWPEAKDDGKSASGERPDLSDQLDYQFRIEITCASEAEQEKMYNELTERGFQCRILTL